MTTSSVSERLAALGIQLPPADAPRGMYRPAVRSGSQIWLAGQGPTRGNELVYTGRIGAELDVEQGQAAARLCMINLLAQLQRACDGDLSRVVRCLSATVYVASAPGFFHQPRVADGATSLLAELWGQENLPARSAVGMFVLPMNIAVEIDAVFEVR